MIELSRYAFEALRKDNDFVLYRSRSKGDLSPILVLAPAAERPGSKYLKRLEHEYALRDELDPAWAARPIGIARYWDRPVLMLEDPGGLPLARFLGQPLEPADFLSLAICVGAAVGQLHGRGMVHKDIKPGNLLVDSSNGRAFLTGFAIASRLPRERQSPEPAEVIAGTLAYMAPEQTGRMNRSIDYRSDLYSLGVILYEMLTGTLPFSASDPMGWVHCHVAKQPVPPAERAKGIPQTFSDIVMRLLAKTAEDRYQTAAGLEADLRRCLVEWESFGHIDPYTLGSHDTSDRLLIPEKLYGRDREREILLDSFNRVAGTGSPILVLVSGYAGIGKSSIVHELHKAIVLRRGIFISAKFDQYKRDIPYATLAQAFQNIVRQILGKSDAEVNRWRELLREALGANAQLIVGLIPELELVIGKQPPVPEISEIQAEYRFHAVFRAFLSVVARKEHPLVLFLDDLQWLDTATLKLCEDFMTQPGVNHLLLIGAFRDNEVSPGHPLARALQSIRRTQTIVRDIVLAPLSLHEVTEFVADTLGCREPAAEPLARLVHEKTLGNPFFAIQFLAALREQHLLEFDPSNGEWTWDLERIRTKGYTDNVVDLMAGKLNRLPQKTQAALKQLACLGNEANFATLSLLLAEPEEALHSSLWEAFHAGYVARTENGCKFLHDRVLEAAYSLISEKDRPATHLRIGRLLAARAASEQVDENVFEIVNQLNLGAELITEPQERAEVAKLNFIAGIRARNSTAYLSALRYFTRGRALLAGNHRPDDCSLVPPGDSAAPISTASGTIACDRLAQHDLSFALELHIAQCEYLTGALNAAEERLSRLSLHEVTLVDFAAVTAARINLYITQGRNDRAVEVCLEYLRSVGVNWSPHPSEDEVHQEYEELWRRIGSRPIESLIDLPAMPDSQWRVTMDLLSQIVAPALYTDRNLLSLIVSRMANLSLEHGNADTSAYGYIWLGKLLGAVFDDYQTGYRFGKLAFDLVDRRGKPRQKPRIYLGFGAHVVPWAKHLRVGIDMVRRAFDMANETGELNFAAYSCWNLLVLFFAEGKPLSGVQDEAEKALRFVKTAKFGPGLVADIHAQLQLIRTLMGRTSSLGSFNDAEFSEELLEEELERDPALAFHNCFYWICKLQAHFHARNYAAAIEASEKVKYLSWTHPSFFELAEYHFYSALACAGRCRETQNMERARYNSQLAVHHAQLRFWAENCPETFGNRAFLVSAEIARAEGRDFDAMKLYEQAISSARENGFVQNEAVAWELAAAFYAAHGFDKIALGYLRDARHCYQRWGAEGKVRQLDELHPDLPEELSAPLCPTATIGTPVEQLDLATVIKVSHVISGEIVLEKLIDTLLRTAIEQAGAEKGLLILPQVDEQRVEAEVRTDRDHVAVHFRQSTVTPLEAPGSLLRYVTRTNESVTLSDASAENPFSGDGYFRRNSPRSVLCIPLVKQRKTTGILYFENSLTPGVFTPKRLAILELLASQAAISLEQARLYAELRYANEELQAEIRERKLAQQALEKSGSELRRSEQRLQDIVDNSTALVFVKDLEFRYLLINRAYERCFHVKRDEIVGKTDFDIFSQDVAQEYRCNDRKVLDGGFPIQFEEPVLSDQENLSYLVVKFPLRDGAGTPYGVCGIATDITALKRAEELEGKVARERELFAQQRATQLAKATEALRGSLDALASAPELDNFLGRVLAAIAGQLGATSSTLRLHKPETDTWEMEFLFHEGRIISGAEARMPKGLGTLGENLVNPFTQSVGVFRLVNSDSMSFDAYQRYLLSVGIKTLVTIPLISRNKSIGILGLRFAEDREFHPDELEIARALATQASLAIQLSKLAKAARQSAVLQERSRLADEIHDSLAQSFAAISMQLGMAQETLKELLKNDDAGSLNHIQRANDLACFGLAEARRTTLSLRPASADAEPCVR